MSKMNIEYFEKKGDSARGMYMRSNVDILSLFAVPCSVVLEVV